MNKYFKEINGIRTEIIESHGVGTPVFIFHGNSSGASAYVDLLQSEVGDTYKLIAVSFPGHGESTYYREDVTEVTIEKLGEFTVDVVNSFGFDKYVLIGQSLGGHALLESLPAHANATGLVLVSSPPIALSRLGDAFLADPTDGLLFKGELSEQECARFGKAFVQTGSIDKLQELITLIESTHPQFREQLGAGLGAGKVLDEVALLKQSNLPCLMLKGEFDRFLNSAYYDTLLNDDKIKADVITFPGAGHAIQVDLPTAFEVVVGQFIANVTSANISKPAVASSQEPQESHESQEVHVNG